MVHVVLHRVYSMVPVCRKALGGNINNHIRVFPPLFCQGLLEPLHSVTSYKL